MGIKSLKTISVKDSDLSKVQSNVKLFVESIKNSEIIDGVLVTNMELIPGRRNEIQHKLKREPLGYIIVRKRADSRIWDLNDTNPGPKDTFTLACSHLVTVDIWFF